MPNNDGTELDSIVAMIEGTRLPPGFTTEKRYPVYDDNGIQVAERDLIILASPRLDGSCATFYDHPDTLQAGDAELAESFASRCDISFDC